MVAALQSQLRKFPHHVRVVPPPVPLVPNDIAVQVAYQHGAWMPQKVLVRLQELPELSDVPEVWGVGLLGPGGKQWPVVVHCAWQEQFQWRQLQWNGLQGQLAEGKYAEPFVLVGAGPQMIGAPGFVRDVLGLAGVFALLHHVDVRRKSGKPGQLLA